MFVDRAEAHIGVVIVVVLVSTGKTFLSFRTFNLQSKIAPDQYAVC